MRISIENFRGLQRLDAAIAPLLLIAGPNAQGKSSACIAIGAAASGALLPFAGVTKKAAQLLVHDGCEGASAMISTDEGTAAAAWPSVERATQGIFRDASTVAVGFEDITAMAPIERAGRLIELIGAAPTKGHLLQAMTDAELPTGEIDKVWSQIAKGWDAAHLHYKDLGAKQKGAWERLANTRYGATKALQWRPAGWELALEGKGVEELERAVAAAESALDAVKAQAGADKAQIEAWQAEAGALPRLRIAFAEANADMDKAAKRANEAETALAALGAKPVLLAEPYTCPCCQAPMRLVEGALVPAEEYEPDVILAAIRKHEAAEDALRKARETERMAQTYVAAARGKVESAEAAAARLESAPQGGASSLERENAELDLELARKSLHMKQQVIESVATVEKIQALTKLVDLLDRDGLRQSVLVDRLGDFNGELVANSKALGWAPVHVDKDMGVSYDGRLFSLCSESEKFRARVTLQLTIARAEQAPLVIIDGADILDRAGRNGLLGFLAKSDLRAVIGMTILRREDMPDLAAMGLGQSVWIERGHVARNVQEAA